MNRSHWPAIILLTLLCAGLFGACGGEAQPPLIATDILIQEPLPGRRMSAGYLTLTNTTENDIVITHVSSTGHETVQMHESFVVDGIAKMRPVEELVVAANAAVVLRAGGKHLMLMKANQSDSVSLNFHNGDFVLLTVSAPVTQRTKP